MAHTSDSRQAVDAVVVGGGLAGLITAITAARAGATVTVVDARSVGGRARSVVRDGFVLNEGAHALYRHGAAASVLRELGVAYTGAAPRADTYRMVWDGEIVPLPVGPGSLATSRVLTARSKVKFAGWLSQTTRLVDRCGDVAVGDWLDAQHAGDDLRRLALALMRLGSYAARPEAAAARPLLRQLGLAAGGVVYVDGGWQSLVDGLALVAVASDVVIVEHEPVTAVQRDGGRWIVGTARRSIAASTVVFAAGGPAGAAALLGDDAADWTDRAGPVQRAAVLDVGGPASRHGFLLSADEPLYLSTHAPVAKLAPGDHHLVSAMRYLAADDHDGATANRAALERHCAAAGVAPSGARVVERFLAAPVVSWGSPTPGVERPSGVELADRGLLAAGDWVGEHLLADAAAASGRAAGLAAARRSVAA